MMLPERSIVPFEHREPGAIPSSFSGAPVSPFCSLSKEDKKNLCLSKILTTMEFPPAIPNGHIQSAMTSLASDPSRDHIMMRH